MFSLKKDAIIFSGALNDERISSYCKMHFVCGKTRIQHPRNRQLIYHHEFSVLSTGSELDSEEGGRFTEYLPRLIVEQQVGNLVTAVSEPCPPSIVTIVGFDKRRIDDILSGPDGKYYTQSSAREHPLLEEIFYPPGYYIEVTTPPWLLDELWLEHFGREWIPFDLKERIAKFPQAAQFFAERHPQVVPDEAWALLGGKPATP